RFARGADHGCDPEILRPIFTDDAVFEVGDFGTYKGGDEIARSMHANNKTGFYWTLHYLVSREIHVADGGREATAFYYLWEPAASPREGEPDQAYWIGGWYNAKLRKGDDGEWRYSHLALTLKLLSPYGEGWKSTAESFDDV
ncbi:MAG: nuclear transport factor 2 family protein, partial [Sphingomonadales bacterium]